MNISSRVPIKKKKNNNKNSCRKDFKNCRYYNSNFDIDSHCVKDSNIGQCIEEQKAIKDFEEFMEEYDNSEVVKK